MADDTITAPLRALARLYDRRIHAALDFPEKLVELWPEIAAALDAADELVREHDRPVPDGTMRRSRLARLRRVMLDARAAIARETGEKR